jgi:hypothetical protein
MSAPPFQHHRQAALALLSECPDLPRKTAGFLGHACVDAVLSVGQRNWLNKELLRNGFQPLPE